MASGDPIRIWDGVDKSKTKNLWGSQSISNINTTLNNTLPSNAVISKVVLKVYGNIDSVAANVYLNYGFSTNTTSIGKELSGGDQKVDFDSACLPSSGIDITSYMSSKTSPFAITTAHGGYFVAHMRTTNVFFGSSGKMHIDNADLEITYTVHTHSYTSAVTKQPTCETAGETTYTCSCGDSYVDKTKPMALGHSWVDATCTAPKTCLRCGVTEGSALSHNYYVEEVTAPPDDRGHTKYTCSRCGHYYFDNYTYPIELQIAKTVYDGIEGGGTITGVANGEHCEVGKTLTLTAVPDSGYAFSHWEKIAEAGVVDAGTDNPLVITQPDSFLVVTAYFKKEPKITSVQMLYQNQQISETNKVLTNQFFRIVVGVE